MSYSLSHTHTSDKGFLGFTLIELLIVVSILGILAVGTVALLSPTEKRNKSKDATTATLAQQIANGISMYHMNTGEYPWPSTGFLTYQLYNENSGVCGDLDCSTDGVLIESGELNSKIRKMAKNYEHIVVGRSRQRDGDPPPKNYVCYQPHHVTEELIQGLVDGNESYDGWIYGTMWDPELAMDLSDGRFTDNDIPNDTHTYACDQINDASWYSFTNPSKCNSMSNNYNCRILCVLCTEID